MGNYLRLLVFISAFLFLAQIIYSQDQKQLSIVFDDSTNCIDESKIGRIITKQNKNDNDSIYQIIMDHLYNMGYLKASLDSIVGREGETILYINCRNKHFFKLTSHNLPESFLRSSKVREIKTGKVYEFERIQDFEFHIISYYENNGFPLASISRENFIFSEDTIEFFWKLRKGQQFLIEEISITGDVNLHSGYISGLSGLRQGSPYSETRLQRAGKKLLTLDFARLASSPLVLFTPSGAKIEFPLERLKSNRFDGIAGLMSIPAPDNETIYRISGQLNLFLLNSLGYGELIDINWRAPGEGSQQLKLRTSFPYILGTPVEADYDFFMNKQDSTFLMVKQKPMLSFLGYGIFDFSTFIIFESNSVFINESLEIKQNELFANYKKTLYGAEIRLKSGIANHTFNKGWRVKLSGATGNRTLQNKVPGHFIPEKTIQYVSEINMQYHLPFANQSLFTASAEFILQTGEKLLHNELYRIGGFNSLKGFDENSILCSSYGVLTLGYRFYFAEEAFLSALGNFAWVENNSITAYSRNYPLGLATGLHFKTRPGIMSIYYGLGKFLNDEFQFRNAKIHVGFISVF